MRWGTFIGAAACAIAGALIAGELSDDSRLQPRLTDLEEQVARLEKDPRADELSRRIDELESRLNDLEGTVGGLSDEAPARAREEECGALTISRAYWFDSSERPEWISADSVKADGSGHILIHVEEHRDDQGVAQYRDFYQRADKNFVLRADGANDVPARAERGMWNQEFYLRVMPTDLSEMRVDVPYQLVPLNRRTSPCRWQTRGDVALVRREDQEKERVPE